jgi:DNA polymerase V
MIDKTTHGGARPGAGRPANPEPMQRVRVPESLAPAVVAYLDAHRQTSSAAQQDEPGAAIALDPRPVAADPPRKPMKRVGASVPAGFPSPADDYMQEVLDFNEHLVKGGHRDATFVLKVSGWSMHGAGIHDGDEIVVDRAITPSDGHVVVAVINGELTIKRLRFKDGKPVLVPENPHFKERKFEDGDQLEIWGVATRVLHKL